MDSANWATWVGSVAATVAAVASVAVWWRGRADVTWQLEPVSQGFSQLVNTGTATAKHVRVRVGSASSPGDRDVHVDRDALAPGENVPVPTSRDMGDPQDFGVIVTWRSAFRGRQAWIRLVL